jgi:hypothetical protein
MGPEHPDSAVIRLMAQTECILSCITRLMQQHFRLKQHKLIYINNCTTRCNTKQSIYYSASSLYMFRVSTAPIIRSTQNFNYSHRRCAATSLQRDQVWPRWREVAAQKNMTSIWGCSYSFVYSDDGRDWHPKHVDWTCRIINRLLRVASRWVIINIDQRCTEL